jgi:hypothetical protein
MGPGSAMGGAHGRWCHRRHPTAPGRRTGCLSNVQRPTGRSSTRGSGRRLLGNHHSASPRGRIIRETDSHDPGDKLASTWRHAHEPGTHKMVVILAIESHDPGTATPEKDTYRGQNSRLSASRCRLRWQRTLHARRAGRSGIRDRFGKSGDKLGISVALFGRPFGMCQMGSASYRPKHVQMHVDSRDYRVDG